VDLGKGGVVTDSPWITIGQLADRLMVPTTTLAYWRQMKKGPRYARFGVHVRYRITDVEAWEESQLRGETG
jgi:hypothetical protein